MSALTDRGQRAVLALLFHVPLLPEEPFEESMRRQLRQLCGDGLLARHVAYAQTASEVALFYHWAPGMRAPDFGAWAWELRQRWDSLEPKRVVFYTATDLAAKHFGRTVRSPLKSIGALAHNIGLGMLYTQYDPLLVSAWVAEEVIAEARSYGEKVIDACIVDSTSTPALAIEFAGTSYSASNGERLREIHADCCNRQLPYEIWTIANRRSR